LPDNLTSGRLMATFTNQYKIKFGNLAYGCHHFDFKMTDRFFEYFQNPEFTAGNFAAEIQLEKKRDHMACKCMITGTINIMCDRCLEYFDLPVYYEGLLYLKYTRGEKDDDADVIYLDEQDHEVNLAQYFYESICLSIPFKRVHADDKNGNSTCNKKMLDKLKEHSPPEQKQEYGQLWNKLKNLIDNQN